MPPSMFSPETTSGGGTSASQAVGLEPIDSSTSEVLWESWGSGAQPEGPSRALGWGLSLSLALVLPRVLAPSEAPSSAVPAGLCCAEGLRIPPGDTVAWVWGRWWVAAWGLDPPCV